MILAAAPFLAAATALLPGSAAAQVRVAPAATAGHIGSIGAVGGFSAPVSARVGAVRLGDMMIHSHFPMDGAPRVTVGYNGPGPTTVKRDPQTRLYGVDAAKVKGVVAILKEHYGDDLIDLAAIGSRARGSASELKGFRPVREDSDLDLALLLRPGETSTKADAAKIGGELKELLGFPVDMHMNFSFDGRRYSDGVPFHDGTDKPKLIPFGNGEAVRLF